jgi:hypothetical protein
MSKTADRTEYIVICRGDTGPSAMYVFGTYELATRTVFPTKALAEKYALGIAEGRQALVIPGRWGGLRWDAAKRFAGQK